jgi:uncharacterized Fe-S cluster-containing radical SAM superfamily protein
MDLIATQSGKFVDPAVTLDGKTRATVALGKLETLWLNTGTLCNLTCENCYIESSPTNDRLVYLTRAEVTGYLDEIASLALPVGEIGITGGEPFMNPDIVGIVEDCLERGFRVLVLTNAMRPMMKCADDLLALNERYGGRLTIRVSVDHHDPERHREERGPRSWRPMIRGLKWLADNSFSVHVAGRSLWADGEDELRAGFAELFAELDVGIDAFNPSELVIFPEMDGAHDVPEITTECWGILGVEPNDLMCASARMVVKRKGADAPEVVACTLLPYEPEFAYGSRLADSLDPVSLNHPHCARFCVLGGGSCSG